MRNKRERAPKDLQDIAGRYQREGHGVLDFFLLFLIIRVSVWGCGSRPAGAFRGQRNWIPLELKLQ